jgi:N-methylhydantoinase A
VTDANLLLGRLVSDRFAGGSIKVEHDRARKRFEELKGPLASVEEFASGILRIIESHMQRAVRVVSVERGHDPRRFALLAFGGGGPLHACALARALEIPHVLVPILPGALSALGILLADAVWDISRTVMLPQAAIGNLDEQFLELENTCSTSQTTAPGALIERSVDIRYRGQGYELNVPHSADTLETFHLKHEQRYGFADRNRPVELVNLRVRFRQRATEITFPERPPREGDGGQAVCGAQQVYFDGKWHTTTLYNRDLLYPGDTIQGPALIAEYTSTTVVPPSCRLSVDRWSNLLIQVT